nr:hypothetical protein [Tanacetum cinerariifolium]
MIVKLGYGVVGLIYYHFLRPRLGLDFGLHLLTVDVDVLELAKNLTKEWEKISSNGLSIGEVMKKLSNKQPACYDKGPIVVETDDLDEILGDYANIRKEITGKEKIGHVEVKVDTDNETKEESTESDIKENDTSGSALEDLDYDLKHDEVFDNDEHILEDTLVKISDPDEATQYGCNSKSVSFVIHHNGCFTPTPSRFYVGGQVSSDDVVDIDKFCLHDLKEMIVKLGYGVVGLIYYHFLRHRLGLDFGLHLLTVDVDVLELAKFCAMHVCHDAELGMKRRTIINQIMDRRFPSAANM